MLPKKTGSSFVNVNVNLKKKTAVGCDGAENWDAPNFWKKWFGAPVQPV